MRRRRVGLTLKGLLSTNVRTFTLVFDHYLKDFARPQIISAIYHPVDAAVDAMTQVNYFVQERLTGAERARFFPVSLNS